VLLVIMAVLGFRSLAYIRGMLVPGLDPKALEVPEKSRNRAPMIPQKSPAKEPQEQQKGPVKESY